MKNSKICLYTNHLSSNSVYSEHLWEKKRVVYLVQSYSANLQEFMNSWKILKASENIRLVMSIEDCIL